MSAPGRPGSRLRRTAGGAAVALALALGLSLRAGARECLDCHAGGTAGAPRVALVPGTAHAEMACAECHPGVEPPCRRGLEATACDGCHGDTADRIGKASHGAGLTGALKSKDPKASRMSCGACHEPSAHAVRRAADPSSPASRERASETCLACHARDPGDRAARFLGSAHHAPAKGARTESATCVDCHGSHVIEASRLPASRTHRANIPATCGGCHPEARDGFREGVHGRAAARGECAAPVCTDCHGDHGIRAGRGGSEVVAACSACHAAERVTAAFRLKADRVSSFRESYHGLALRLGDDRVANCGSCHGSHRILPSDDPRSTVHRGNLGRTCGACHGASCGICHDGVPAGGIRGTVHVSPGRPSHPVVGVVRTLYIGLIGLLAAVALLHQVLDARAKGRGLVAFAREPGLIPRLSAGERVQHAVLALSFVVLALSGFALAFPESPLAWPFRAFGDPAGARRWVHRGAAAAFAGLALVHLLYLLLTRRGRDQVRLLLPRRRDLRDARRSVAACVRGAPAPVPLPPYSYAEKAEYWALVWGATVMSLTGLPLLFIDFSLAHVRLWAIELAQTVHFWEAVLAVVTLVLVHGYAVFLDPEIRPMNRAWWTGDRGPGGSRNTD